MLKGLKGLHETEEFITTFPLANNPMDDTVLSVAAFDVWADQNGFYSMKCEQATLLERRNRLKKKINLTASSPAWMAKPGRTPYFIAVNDHGKSLKVQRVEDAFSVKAVKLPQQVKSYAGTKRDMIKALLGSIDMTALSPAWQMRIAGFDREIERYLRGIDYQTTELDREYVAIRGQLKQLVDSKLIADSRLLGLLDEDDDDEEGED